MSGSMSSLAITLHSMGEAVDLETHILVWIYRAYHKRVRWRETCRWRGSVDFAILC